MTGELSTTANPLSRITIGTLDDMGYTVDYSTADAYGTADLDPSCLCRRRRSLWDGEHGEVLLMESPEDDRRHLRRDTLRKDLREYAIQQGQKILKESAHMNNLEGDAMYVGDQQVSIIMLQGDQVYSVIVTRDG